MKLQKISISENFWGPSAGWSPSAFPDSKTVAAIIANGRQLTRGGERARGKERLIPGRGLQSVILFACVALKKLPSSRASASSPKMGFWMDLGSLLMGCSGGNNIFSGLAFWTAEITRCPQHCFLQMQGSVRTQHEGTWLLLVFCCDPNTFLNQAEAPRSPQPLGLYQKNPTWRFALRTSTPPPGLM